MGVFRSFWEVASPQHRSPGGSPSAEGGLGTPGIWMLGRHGKCDANRLLLLLPSNTQKCYNARYVRGAQCQLSQLPSRFFPSISLDGERPRMFLRSRLIGLPLAQGSSCRIVALGLRSRVYGTCFRATVSTCAGSCPSTQNRGRGFMARDQNTYAKRWREMDKKRKAEEKRARRRRKKEEEPGNAADAANDVDQPAQET